MTDSVWLVRHASTAWSGRRWCGRTDLPLTSVGEDEAERLAVRLGGVLPAGVEVVSSPLLRARATAAPIAGAFELTVRVDLDLREVDFGAAEGLAWPELERTLPRLAQALAAGRTDIDWPGGDSAAETTRRARAIWRGVERSDSACLLLVSHGGTIGGLLTAAGVEAAGGMVPPASATPLRRSDGRWSISGPQVSG